MSIQELFAEAIRLVASDIHLIVGNAPVFRVNGELKPLSHANKLTDADVGSLVSETIGPELKEMLHTNKEIDYSVQGSGARFRVNVYYQKNTLAADFRLIPEKIRSITELGLPSICNEFVKLRQGLVLVTGPTGHGKTTTLAAMINSINLMSAKHIVTIEDPIEYVYPQGLSLISQREMHQDTHSWTGALRSVLREDPDVVLVGEMRDLETISATLTVAETGHLVFATLHTNSAAQTIDRIVDVFPQNQQGQIRMQLANVLEGVLSQRLVPSISGGRVAISEILTGTQAVRSTIREGKTHLLDNVILTSAEMGMATMEASLAKAVQSGIISVDTASMYALRPAELARLLKPSY
jgi:twitching motility protein PilT